VPPADIRPHALLWITGLLWLTLLTYWFVSSFQKRTTVRGESHARWLLRITPLMCGYALLLYRPPWPEWLGRRFVPPAVWIGALGVLLTAAGVALAVWARRHLGPNWSATISIRAGHELIGTGPYRRIRHPIYSGFVLATVGTVLTLGQMRGLVALAVVVLHFTRKAHEEDAWLAREFGAPFEAHRRRTGMFLPGPGS
jgi:protein-S-isoprenylcysteine O-methyltransferase Ste14